MNIKIEKHFTSPIATEIQPDNDFRLELELRRLLREHALDPKLLIQRRKGRILIESEPHSFDLTLQIVKSKHPDYELHSYQENVITLLLRGKN